MCTGCRYICFLLVFLSGTNWYWANYASRFSTCAVQRLSNVSARTHVTTWPSSLSGLIIQTTSRRPDPVSSVVVFPDNSKWSSSYFFKDRCIGHKIIVLLHSKEVRHKKLQLQWNVAFFFLQDLFKCISLWNHNTKLVHEISQLFEQLKKTGGKQEKTGEFHAHSASSMLCY